MKPSKFLLPLVVIFIVAVTIYSAMAATDLTCEWYDNTCSVGSPVLYMANQSANYTNAHAQLANYTPHYSSVLCCNSSLAINTSSTGEGVLKLSGQSNAHVQFYNNTDFTTKYSYSAYISTNESKPLCRNYSACPTGYTCLVSVSGIGTNAHIAGCNQSYSNKVCCKARTLSNINLSLAGSFPYTLTATENNAGDSDITYTLFRNNVSITSPDSITLPGTYVYVYNTSGDGENYTYTSTTMTVSVSMTNTSSLLYIINTINFTGTYPANSTTFGYGCPAELTCTLYYDGTPVSNPYYNLIWSGNHTLTYSTPGNENYTAASITWYIGPINESTTTVVNTTTVVTTGGGGGGVVQFCSYALNRQLFYEGDEVQLMFRCPTYIGNVYSAEWVDDKTGLIYNTNLGTIQAVNNITYKSTRPVESTIRIKTAGAPMFEIKFKIHSIVVKSLNYLSMIGVGLAIITGVYLMTKLESYEKRRRKNQNATFASRGEATTLAVLFTITGGFWVYVLYYMEKIGYIYMILISLLLLSVMYFLNKLFNQSPLSKKEKGLLIGISIVIGGILIYALSKSYAGYLQMGIVALVVLGVIMLFNKLIKEVK